MKKVKMLEKIIVELDPNICPLNKVESKLSPLTLQWGRDTMKGNEFIEIYSTSKIIWSIDERRKYI